MKLRFGEFPDHHHFLLVTRPFVEWTFKYFGWLLLTSTIRFAYERTENRFLFYLMCLCYLLLLAFIGAFVDWVLGFRRYRIISGKKLVEAAEHCPPPKQAKESLLQKIRTKTRGVVFAIVGLMLTISLGGMSYLATDKIINAFIEFQQKAR